MSALRVLVICHANVARSVLAAAFLADALDANGARFEIRSAGTHATSGQPASRRTLLAAESILPGAGAAVRAHRAHLLEASDLEWAGLTVAMEAAQVRFVRARHPERSSRTANLAQLVALARDGVEQVDLAELEPDPGFDVVDPAGGDDETYLHCAQELEPLCRELARILC